MFGVKSCTSRISRVLARSPILIKFPIVKFILVFLVDFIVL